jgi:hypothetical protein
MPPIRLAAPPQAAQPYGGEGQLVARPLARQDRAMRIWREKANKMAIPQNRQRASSMRVLTPLA